MKYAISQTPLTRMSATVSMQGAINPGSSQYDTWHRSRDPDRQGWEDHLAPVDQWSPARIRFAVLGRLEAHIDGHPMRLGPVKQQVVLAMLLCRPNAAVPVDALVDALWDDDPPRTARKNLQVYVCELRKLLGAANPIIHDAGGYTLRVSPPELDLLRFEELARAGRRSARGGGLEDAARELRQALDLWRGPLLAGLPGSAAIRSETERMEQRLLAVYEDWAETELAIGNAAALVDGIGDMVREHPFRERLRAAQLNALSMCGRQTEALAAYDDLRQLLARDLGLQPSAPLEKLYRTLLTGEPVAARRSLSAVDVARPRTLLPRDLPDFTGRGEQVRELLEALGSRGRSVVVTGPVGVGKTSLAVRAAHRLGHEFPDGRVFVRLRGDDGGRRPWGSVMADLLRATGLTGGVPDDREEALSVWHAWLADRRVLVIMDDAPDESAVRPLLPGAGASGAVVTARPWMAGLESAHHLDVPPYTMAEAVELLGRIVGVGRVLADRAAAQRIVSAAGFLPLAVRIAAAKLAGLRHLPLSDYAARLNDEDRLLNELAVGDTAVRDRLDAGLLGLSSAQRSAIPCLGRLPSALFTLDEAAAVLGCGQEEARRILESLIEASVVVSPQSEVSAHMVVYELPRLAHLHARELAAAGETRRLP